MLHNYLSLRLKFDVMHSMQDPAAFAAAHAFSSYANWVIPGRLMVGRYPYVEPNQCRWVELSSCFRLFSAGNIIV